MEKGKMLYVGYGFTGEAGLHSLLTEGSVDIVTVIAPPIGENRYRKNGEELPLEKLAMRSRIPIVQTNENNDIYTLIQKTKPDSVLLCAYNKILSEEILELGPSFFNMHHGLYLPRLRGSSNTEWAVRKGLDKITLSLFKMVPGLDAGDIYWEPEISITNEETITDLRRKMNAHLREYLGKAYAHILNPGKYPELAEVVYPRSQKDITPTYACSIREEDSLIEWKQPAKEIYNLIRSVCDLDLDPAFTFYQGEQIKVWKAKIVPCTKVWEGHIPGKPITRGKEGVEVLTGDASSNILLEEVEYLGKRMPAKDAIRSIRDTFGLHPHELLARVKSLEERLRALEVTPQP